MKNRIALALFPVALFSMAGKGGCSEDPIVAVDAGSPTVDAGGAAPDTGTTGVGDCTIPEPSCPPGTKFFIPDCACVATTPEAGVPDSPTTGSGDCPIPEPSCPPGSEYFIPDCACVSIVDATAPDVSTSLTCAQRTTDAQNATIAAETQAEADLSCTGDSDCVVADNSSACWNSCGVVLNQAGAAELQAAIAQINATTCANFAADGCQANPAPPCAAFMAHCVNDVCTNSP